MIYDKPNPGDLIEWVYEKNHQRVRASLLWSIPMTRIIPVIHGSLLIAVHSNKYVWINSEGTFTAFFNDRVLEGVGPNWIDCIIRTIK